MVLNGQVSNGTYRRFAGVLLLVAALASCVCLNGCSGSDDEAGPVATVVHTYTLRGRIVSLPSEEDPASELRIHHEAIDTFKNAEGEASPMKAMTMTFPPAPGVSLEGLSVGDAVEFVFQVQWEPSGAMSATSINKLPAGTELSIDSAEGAHDPHAGH